MSDDALPQSVTDNESITYKSQLERERLRARAAESRRGDVLGFLLGLAIFIIVLAFIMGVVISVRAGDAAKDRARLSCIQQGHTWIDPASCVAGK